MPLAPGTKLGHYSLTELIGRGGMGEVYKALDTKLNRHVALKVLPGALANNPERMARFQREAQLLASLNHPNIAAIYGLEDSGSHWAIVMELVEGDTLKGPLPIPEALRLAKQIADAVEYAHDKTVIHRDLKPANIKVTPEGQIKVLDFGLAKALDDAGSSHPETNPMDSMSPTLTMGGTAAGVILGTAAYMAPEQAKGKRADRKADIWSFGVVLYEMLTGKRVFAGETMAETLASVMKEQLTFDDLPKETPSALRKLVTRCLDRDLKRRVQSMGEVRIALEDLLSGAATEEVRVVTQPAPAKPFWIPWAVATVFAITTGVATWMWRSTPPTELQSVQFALNPPPDERFINQAGGYALSPDGRYIVFTSVGKGSNSLWLRPIDSMSARLLPGAAGANFPFWSPDSKSIVFTALNEQKLRRLEISGGASLELADTPGGPVTSTGTWNQDGVIVFGGAAGLERTSASGGGAKPLTKVDPKQKETGHGYPQFLPDGKRFLYFVASDDTNIQGVYASSLDAPDKRTLIVRTDAKAVYVPPKGGAPGYLLWMQENSLVAQRFNLDNMEREGDPVSVAESVSRAGPNPVRAAYWASDAGSLIYFSGGDVGTTHRVVRMSRDGKLLGDALPEGDIIGPALSPDETRLAISRGGGAQSRDRNIGVWEFNRSVATRLTFEKEDEALPVWSPDSKYIAYIVAGKGIYRKDASGASQPELLLQEAAGAEPMDWSHDGKYLMYRISNSATGRDLWAIPLADAEPAGKPFPVVVRPFEQSGARFSPNGKWISFSSTENGQQEVFIQPFVPPTAASPSPKSPDIRWQVSNAGAGDTAWRGDGKEIFFESLTGDILAATLREEGAGLKIDAPRLLFKVGSDRNSTHSFDATRDGQQFIIQLPSIVGSDQTTLTVVTNWQSALRK